MEKGEKLSIEEKIKGYNRGVSEVYGRLPTKTIAKIVEALLQAFDDGKKIIAMGNGGHGSTASHFINDLVKHTIAWTGYEGGRIKDFGDICFIVPSDNISFIEDVHFSLVHMCCDIIRKIL